MKIPSEIFENDFEIRKYGDGHVIDGLEVLPKEHQEVILKEIVMRYNLHNELLEACLYAVQCLNNLSVSTGDGGDQAIQVLEAVIKKEKAYYNS
jgi:hypothetical protein